jgi:hypothetical protein
MNPMSVRSEIGVHRRIAFSIAASIAHIAHSRAATYCLLSAQAEQRDENAPLRNQADRRVLEPSTLSSGPRMLSAIRMEPMHTNSQLILRFLKTSMNSGFPIRT